MTLSSFAFMLPIPDYDLCTTSRPRVAFTVNARIYVSLPTLLFFYLKNFGNVSLC